MKFLIEKKKKMIILNNSNFVWKLIEFFIL